MHFFQWPAWISTNYSNVQCVCLSQLSRLLLKPFMADPKDGLTERKKRKYCRVIEISTKYIVLMLLATEHCFYHFMENVSSKRALNAPSGSLNDLEIVLLALVFCYCCDFHLQTSFLYATYNRVRFLITNSIMSEMFAFFLALHDFSQIAIAPHFMLLRNGSCIIFVFWFVNVFFSLYLKCAIFIIAELWCALFLFCSSFVVKLQHQWLPFCLPHRRCLLFSLF